MADERIEVELVAVDDASDTIEQVADAAGDLPERATVDVDADTGEALTALERFERQVDGLTDDARELRVEFRAQQLQRDIRNALRDLERLEDPTDIDIRTDDLERAQRDLRELAELAGRKYAIDVDADPKRTAQRAAGDVDLIRQRGEGLQSALPALRGFTDELGATAANAGIAGQALGDLGDFSLIMGERFGISERATAGLGTALGAAGLATIIAGVAVPALQALTSGQNEARYSAEDLLAAQEALAEGNTERAAAELAATFGDLAARVEELGGSSTGLAEFITATNEGGIRIGSEAWRELRTEIISAREAFTGAGRDLDTQRELAAEFGEALGGVADDAADAAGEVDGFADASADAADEVDAFSRLLGQLRDDLNLEQSLLRAQSSFTRTLTRIREQGSATQLDINDLKLSVIDFAESVENIPPSAVTEILALIDEGSFRVADARLKVLTARETKIIDVAIDRADLPANLAGRIPEFGYSNVTVNLPRAAEARDVVTELERYNRINGRPPNAG